MAKKKKKTKPSVQKRLEILCDLVEKLDEKMSQLQVEVAALRLPNRILCAPPTSPFDGTKPSNPICWVTCKGPPEGLMYNSKGRADERH
jgi:hypothetical protein